MFLSRIIDLSIKAVIKSQKHRINQIIIRRKSTNLSSSKKRVLITAKWLYQKIIIKNVAIIIYYL